jgi:ATP:ADP antiporter, AAA family
METLIKKLVNFKSGEGKALFWSSAYFFFLMSTYYMLRPLRDAMGTEGGTRGLPWLFLATFAATLITVPFQSVLAARLRRPVFIPVVYLFLVGNMILFWFLMKGGIAPVVVARAFFIWTTVFSVFTVSVFWAFMADLYSMDQSKRLFGFIGAGGSIGTILGPIVTAQLVKPIGVANLLLMASVLLVLAVVCSARLEKAAAEAQASNTDFVAASAGRQKAVGGGMFDGFSLLFKSPYLGGIGLWVFLLSLANTFAYFYLQGLVNDAHMDAGARTAFFAQVDAWSNGLSLFMQLVLTGWIISKIGTGRAAALVAGVFLIGFSVFAMNPILTVAAAFQVILRTSNFGIANLARESMWTVVNRDEKFKAKNIVDGAVFRGADALNAQVFNLFSKLLAVPVMAIAVVGIAVGWVFLSLGLGRAQEKRAREAAKS